MTGLSLLVLATAFAGEPAEDARRLTAILDYVAADYRGAVADGHVSDQGEYDEQVGFLADGATLAKNLPTGTVDVPAALAALQSEVGGYASADVVSAHALEIRRRVIESYGVVLAPTAPLTRDQGARLYEENCAMCHGADGGADTPTAKTLTPPPRNFRDPEVMTELSPARAFNGLTDGVKGTAMPSFEALTTQDRWNLAFYIFTLRHDADAEARGAELADEKQIERMSTADLAGVGDGSLAPGVAAHDDAVAWLRGVAPYQTEERVSLAVARDGLDRALTALRAGDRVEARRLAGEAYLAGFEPHEESLRQAVPGQVARVEAGFLTVRAQIDDGASVAVVESEVRRTQALLDDAEASLGGARGAKLAFVGALLVVLREGLEAALLLLLLLGYAERQGAPAVRQVHAGWIAALGVGVLTWFASDSLIALAGARRELLEGGITLLAAGVLVTAHHWLVSAAEGRRRAAHIREQVFGGAAGRWTLTALAFGAVYREAFEVVLFLQAIALDGGTGTSAVLAGAAAAGVLLVGLVFAMLRLGRRVQAAPILKWAGILLCVMAVVFVGKGLRSLQEAGVVPIHSFGALRVGILGVFPTVETLGAQLALTLGLVASAWRPRWRRDEVDSRVAAK